MKRERKDDWFSAIPYFIAFVFVVIIVFWITVVVTVYRASQAGPEGFGRAVGEFMRGIDEGRKQ